MRNKNSTKESKLASADAILHWTDLIQLAKENITKTVYTNQTQENKNQVTEKNCHKNKVGLIEGNLNQAVLVGLGKINTETVFANRRQSIGIKLVDMKRCNQKSGLIANYLQAQQKGKTNKIANNHSQQSNSKNEHILTRRTANAQIIIL